MAKLITFKVPVQDRKTGKLSTEDRRGYVAKLYVGNYQEKFVLQIGPTNDVDCLTHYASGQVVGRLNPIKVRHWSSYSRMTDRHAAELLLADIVARFGADEARAKMNSAPVVNA